MPQPCEDTARCRLRTREQIVVRDVMWKKVVISSLPAIQGLKFHNSQPRPLTRYFRAVFLPLLDTLLMSVKDVFLLEDKSRKSRTLEEVEVEVEVEIEELASVKTLIQMRYSHESRGKSVKTRIQSARVVLRISPAHFISSPTATRTKLLVIIWGN